MEEKNLENYSWLTIIVMGRFGPLPLPLPLPLDENPDIQWHN